MTSRWKHGAVGVIVVGLAAGIFWRQREPDLNGHPISYWVLPWIHWQTETPESVEAAHSAMGQPHVRWLMRALQWRPSTWRRGVGNILNRAGFSVEIETPN